MVEETQNQTGSFEVWYLKSGSTIGQIHGKLSVLRESISLYDESSQIVFSLTPDRISSIHNDFDGVTINSEGQDYILLVQDRIRSAEIMAHRGFLLGVGGKDKNSLASPVAQNIAENLAKTIRENGYEISFQRRKVTKQQLMIVIPVAVLLTLVFGTMMIIAIMHKK